MLIGMRLLPAESCEGRTPVFTEIKYADTPKLVVTCKDGTRRVRTFVSYVPIRTQLEKIYDRIQCSRVEVFLPLPLLKVTAELERLGLYTHV